jgi:glycosyltransferase involved in cell wall biosynthesis
MDGTPLSSTTDNGVNGHTPVVFTSISAPQRLSVLYVAEAFGGGLFEITRKKAEGLAKRGHRVAIAYGIRPETPPDPRAVIHPGVELIPMPWTDRSLGAQIKALRALRQVVDDFAPDVVHLMSSFAGLHGAIALGRRRVPTVYTPQGYAFTMISEPLHKRVVYRALEFFVSRRVSVIGACSQTVGEQARRGLAARRVAVVENGITELDPPGTAPAPVAPAAERRVIALGRPSPQRRPEACARILGAVGDLAEIEWVGGGPESDGIRALADAGIPVTGWLPRAETLDHLSRARVYLHWTAWDGLPLSILEALARDVVVVASDIGPNREVLGPEQVCSTEQEAIALVRAILSDPSLHDRLLTAQRARRGRYSAENMVDRWIGLYSSLAGDDQRAKNPDLIATA